MPEEDQMKVWDLIDEWSQSADESAKAELRERIRKFAFTRRGRRNLGETTRDRAREAYDSLRPTIQSSVTAGCLPISWVQESADEIRRGGFRLSEARRADRRLRREAMSEIWTERGFEGVRELLTGSGAANLVGHYTASCVTGVKPRVDFIRRCFPFKVTSGARPSGACRLPLGDRRRLARRGAAGCGRRAACREHMRLLVCAPFQASTWRLLDGYGEDIRVGYWKDVLPSWGQHSPADLTEMIDRLLEVRRPRAAFNAVQMDFKDIETSRLKRLLQRCRHGQCRASRSVQARPLPYFRGTELA
jgi:hypothetical protein